MYPFIKPKLIAIAGKFMISDEKPMCNSCWEETVPSCFICKCKIIAQRIIASNDIAIHPECFNCGKCSLDIGKSRFVPNEGKIYHEECFVK